MKRISNLYQDIIDASGAVPDRRFKTWVKEVTSVDQSKTNGYAFNGDFINDSTLEYEVQPSVYLVSSTEGSVKNNTTKYFVVTMNADGELYDTGIRCDDDYHRERGWALIIRDLVANLLDEVHGQETPALNLDIVRDHAETVGVNDPVLADLLISLVEYYERNHQ